MCCAAVSPNVRGVIIIHEQTSVVTDIGRSPARGASEAPVFLFGSVHERRVGELQLEVLVGAVKEANLPNPVGILALKHQQVRANPVKEPAVVADDDGCAGEGLQALL
eukprot:CAMPEP_0177638272 /NCGR_PEP_ID=MMETSP0447-20121125/5400_1 /TAXON_ID=0 /ORGANISM="Stygamoeba regulata, Strain BSH-02190019" /LENGTH=107 /DNA_ID=CAMNT_0019140223 /DNA_START=175 /DNA_END=499 /DNA_ORIENTATION=-